MKVFLTGHKGYVGNVMTDSLLKENFDVLGCDLEYYPQGFIKRNFKEVPSLKKDIRDVSGEDLKGCDAVIHLAGLSNDPLGEINPRITEEVNFRATVNLAENAKKAGVGRFIFSSSCSTYGVNSDFVDEYSNLEPLTAYAKSKVNSEKELLKLKDDTFCPVMLRNATVYGLSQSQRLDLVVNNLTCSAYTTGKVELLSDGTSWRPLLHIEDMASAFIKCLKADEDKVSGEIFNVGSTDENYKVKDIAELVEETVPESKVTFSSKASKDARSYRVNFDKIKNNLHYKTKWKLKDGIKQFYDAIKDKEFTEKEFRDKNFYRVAYLKWLVQENKIQL
ncbi:SDR family oxidoreductase [Nitrosopumilus sp. K4]|uniref:NAD-dependent epimerase/dehydratase family protein n=1 Tax=Nitrosopumilus sp. K4 TaxID=2795383 RepID=UPI001BAA8AF0|nr:SDR family oxidoreductase [Nitrosopumilus sp. K4]QUC64783.1 SDR family oxidoreductase [Nitrosopumilus sp. K4]